MSIMDSIEVAEQKADEIRRQARLEAREKLNEAQAQGRAETDRRVALARETARLAVAAAQAQAEDDAKRQLAQMEQEQSAHIESVRANLPAAVEAIVEEALR